MSMSISYFFLSVNSTCHVLGRTSYLQYRDSEVFRQHPLPSRFRFPHSRCGWLRETEGTDYGTGLKVREFLQTPSLAFLFCQAMYQMDIRWITHSAKCQFSPSPWTYLLTHVKQNLLSLLFTLSFWLFTRARPRPLNILFLLCISPRLDMSRRSGGSIQNDTFPWLCCR